MESPLEKIVFQKKGAPGVISFDSGLMIYKQKEVMEWLCIKYKKRYEIYLLLDDLEDSPYRNHLTSGVGRTLEQARKAAVKNMEKLIFDNVH
ncbi:hypothetical protein [Cytobacillus massiliigabonensis]|uniref:hypothetical protein n=1 Tax=Cytobacillus massiliigabonensis TaxID=1871011 RepID=UPI000C85BA23|nr:hypothetical protein [Cytobacillus massiliigabonensis]